MYSDNSISLTIKPTNSCNFRCKHCFNGEHLYEKGLLPIEIALKFIELAAKSYSVIKLTFHGGEPTLAGKEYYRQIFELEHNLINTYGVKFHNIFQTNGYLLDESFIDILVKEKTLISISFDGPHNDILRSNTEAIYNNLEIIKTKDVRLRVFCVETSKSVSDLIQTYEWFKSHKLDYKILPVQPRGFAEDQYDLILDIPQYIDKLMELYRYWLTDKNCDIRLYTFEEFAHLKEDSEFKPLWFDRKLSLNADGKIYPFGRPYDVNFCLGDPLSIECIDDCFKADSYTELKQILKEKIADSCRTCEAFSICRGSCLCSSFVYGNSSDMLEYSCRLAEKTFMTVVKINKEVKKDIELGNVNKYNDKVLKIFD
ncbi:radical SAM protein [Clostridium butyricum]|jgi:radical SAM protein with 4Fe4S-binding SPASM domain|uniref:radical SAM protein n=1 Tax=Clostridium butyricum TaxID=1492 RepID=UPI00374F8630